MKIELDDECVYNNDHYMDKDGYSRVKFNKRAQPVTRILMGLIFGFENIEGKLICHKCGNSSCLNPNHLYVGNAQTNANDMVKHGTVRSGEKNHSFKKHVSTEEIADWYFNKGVSQIRIASIVGVSQSTISERLKKYNSDR